MRRFFKILKWIGLSVVALVSIVLIVTAVRSALAGGRVERQIAALRPHEPVSLAELAQPPIPPEENAATYLGEARSDIEAIVNEIYAAEETMPKAEQDAFDNGRPGPEMIERMRGELAAHPRVPELLEQAANCPDYQPTFDFNVVPEAFFDQFNQLTHEVRGATRAMSYQANVQIADRQLDDALHSCLIGLRLARHDDRIPTISGLLVALVCRSVAIDNAERALQAGPVSLAARDELETELARHDLSAAFGQMLRGERAYGLTSMRGFADKIALGATLPWFKNDEADYLDVMQGTIAATAAPFWQWKDRFDEAGHHGQVGVLTGMVVPALQISGDSAKRVQAQMQSLAALNAIGRHQQAGDLTEPIQLDKLGLPHDATLDPFNGEPLRVKKTPDGWAVYSVGKNLQDDGGVREENSDGPDVGVGLTVLPKSEANNDAGDAKDESH